LGLTRGGLLFSQNCAGCHGQNGENVAKHSLKGITAHMSREQVVKSVENPPAQMPKLFPAPLSAHDVEQIVDYLGSL
jgi:mono/diheme cytochrome c family protein